MKAIEYFVLRRTALDGKSWFCVCYKGIDGKTNTESKHKLKREATYRVNRLNSTTNGYTPVVAYKEV